MLRYPKIYPWVVKILFYLNRFWKPQCELSNFRDNPTMTTSVYLKLLLCICIFRALALHLHGRAKFEETSKIFNLFPSNCEEGDPSKIQGVHMNGISKVEDILHLNIFVYDIDFVDGELFVELVRRSIQKYAKIVNLLRYNSHICYVNKINAFFKIFRCSTLDTFFSKTGNLEQHLVLAVNASNIFTQRTFTS